MHHVLRDLFVEEELKGTFGRLISFVKDTEATMSTPNPDGTHTPRHQTEGLSGRDFVLSIMTVDGN